MKYPNFSNSESELQEYFIENEEDVTAEYTIGSGGYSINLAYYVRLVILIKVVEITYYYSTTGVLYCPNHHQQISLLPLSFLHSF